MLTVLQQPPTFAFAGNPLHVALQTDRVTQNPHATLRLSLTDDAAPALGEQLTIWYGLASNPTVLIFTVTATPDSTGNSLPSTFGSASSFLEALAESFRRNPTVANDFYVIVILADRQVLLTAKSTTLINLNADDLSTIAVLVTNPTITTSNNVKALLSVYNANNQAELTAQIGTFDTQGRVAFQIGAAFAEQTPPFPLRPAIDGSILSPATSGITPYYIRFAERFGTPLATQPSERTPSLFWAIRGATVSRSTALFSTIFPYVWLTEQAQGAYTKPNTPTQPDWVYLLTKEPLTNVYWSATLFWSNGTTTEYTTDEYFSMTTGDIKCFGVGFRQLGLHSVTPPLGTHATGYNFDLKNANAQTLTTLQFALDVQPNHPFNTYILFDNGIGGMESVCLRGQRKPETTVSKDKFELSDGTASEYNVEADEVWEVSTGWRDYAYLRHLRQLLTSKAYLIHFLPETPDDYFPFYHFEPIQIDTDSLPFLPDEATIHALTFRYRLARKTLSINEL